MTGYDCFAVFVGDSETPVYVWNVDVLEHLVFTCASLGLEVEVFSVIR